jgi:predicted ribosomally synthesized peptide with SipW-like signal peptide
MNRKARALILALVVLVLSLALSIGGTYALFSSHVTTNIHLQAGSLAIGLDRVSYQTCTLADDGTLTVSDEDITDVDLTKDENKVFQIDRAVPGCWYQAKIKVTRQGDVAMDYGVRLIWDQANATEEQKLFANQLNITITSDSNQVTTFKLSDATDVLLGSILKDSESQSQYFIIKAQFADDTNNNSVKEISLAFDVQVYATQKTENA